MPAHRVVVGRADARADEDVVLDDHVGGHVDLGLDPHARADPRVVLDGRARGRSRSQSPIVTRSRTKAWSPTITPAPSDAPAKTIAWQQITDPVADHQRRQQASEAAVEERASFGGLPSTAPSWISQPAPITVPAWITAWAPIRTSVAERHAVADHRRGVDHPPS